VLLVSCLGDTGALTLLGAYRDRDMKIKLLSAGPRGHDGHDRLTGDEIDNI